MRAFACQIEHVKHIPVMYCYSRQRLMLLKSKLKDIPRSRDDLDQLVRVVIYIFLYKQVYV